MLLARWLEGRQGRFAAAFRLVVNKEPWWAEFWSASAAISWALISVSNYGDVTLRAVFSGLGELANPHFWEAAGIVLGGAQIWALFNGDKWARWTVAFLMSWWWSLLTIVIVIADIAAPSWGLYACFAGINLVSMMRVPVRRRR